MPSPFHGIETASRALRAFQRSLDTTGHNIANVGTKGYSRQSADLSVAEASTYLQDRYISLGAGVNLTQINRTRDQFMDFRMQDAQGSLGKFEASHSGMKRVESMFLDLEQQGINTAFDTFFNSWSALASNPSDLGHKSQVRVAASDLASKIRNAHSEMEALKTSSEAQINDLFSQVNNLTGQIAKLNAEIRHTEAGGGVPNDLYDQRDQAILQLSKMVDVTTQRFSDGSVSVYMNQLTLVDQAGSRPMPTTFDPTTFTLTDANGTYSVRNGALRGMFDTINSVNGYQTRLDTLANNLRTHINSIHTTGTNGLGNTNVRLFNDVASGPQTGARDLDLDPAIQADVNAIASGVSTAASDGSVALAISRARSETIPALNGQTFQGYYLAVISDVGRAVQVQKANLDAQTSVVTQVETQIQSVSGVSLDDELSNMLRFQRSYQAAAKVLTVFDETLSELINMLRR